MSEDCLYIGTQHFLCIKKTDLNESVLEFEINRPKKVTVLKYQGEVIAGPLMSLDQSSIIYLTRKDLSKVNATNVKITTFH